MAEYKLSDNATKTHVASGRYRKDNAIRQAKLKNEPKVPVYGNPLYKPFMGDLYSFDYQGNGVSIKFDGTMQYYPKTIAELLVKKFSDGELNVDFHTSLRGNIVYLVSSPNTSDKIKNATTSTTLLVNLNYINSFVSPAYDTRASNFVFTTYVSSTNSNNELEARDSEDTLVDSTYRNTTKSRYITKTVNTLQTATNVSVTFDKNQPPDTGIKVYLKRTGPNSSVSFDDAEYIELFEVSRDINPIKSDDFVKTEYRYPINLAEFNTFAVKVVFTTPSDSNRYPSIKNLRVVAI
jgi:hypothetical protein